MSRILLWDLLDPVSSCDNAVELFGELISDEPSRISVCAQLLMEPFIGYRL